MVQLAEERRLLAEERAQVTVSQRVVSEKESAASLTHSQGSAKYEGRASNLRGSGWSLLYWKWEESTVLEEGVFY